MSVDELKMVVTGFSFSGAEQGEVSGVEQIHPSLIFHITGATLNDNLINITLKYIVMDY